MKQFRKSFLRVAAACLAVYLLACAVVAIFQRKLLYLPPVNPSA
jgi:hypothetical protein